MKDFKDTDRGLCWIHIKDVYTFLNLGANPHEQRVGQNIKLDLSLHIRYNQTSDKLKNTTDYSVIIERVQSFIESLGDVNLLEFLAEEIVAMIEKEFTGVFGVRLVIQKAYVPLSHFTGSVAIEVAKSFER